MDGFDSEFDIIFDRSLDELCLLDKLDNSITAASLSSLRKTKERNEKNNLHSFEEADKDDVEKYHKRNFPKNFFKNFP